MIKKNKIVILLAVVLLFVVLGTTIWNRLLNKYSVPDKEERLYNLRVYSGINDLTELDEFDIANDIDAALSKYTNWDNLFLSENFKNKYKNRKNILDDVSNIASVWTYVDFNYGKDVVVVCAEKRPGLFDSDESDDITTEYYFQYVLNDDGEIDDLILLEKLDVYTMSGDPVNDDYVRGDAG